MQYVQEDKSQQLTCLFGARRLKNMIKRLTDCGLEEEKGKKPSGHHKSMFWPNEGMLSSIGKIFQSFSSAKRVA
jgi:hypothetical protein